MTKVVKVCSYCGKEIMVDDNWGGINSKYYHHPDDENAQDCYSLATWAETESGSENNLPFSSSEGFTAELMLTEVSPKLMDILLGPEPRPPFGEQTWIIEANGHKLEGWDVEITEHQDGRHLKFETKFNKVRVLCGPHDEKGNHIDRK